MAEPRPNLRVLHDAYYPNAFADRHFSVTLLRKNSAHAEPSDSDFERIEIGSAVSSIDVTRHQLTVLPSFAWVLGGVIGALALHLLIWAVQYPMGRHGTTEFNIKLRDGRSLAASADIEVCRQLGLGLRSGAAAA